MADLARKFNYTGCGVDNIVLLNGFSWETTSRGRVVKIQDQEGLHRAIGESLIHQKRPLTGRELRFLRHEMGLSQKNLSEWLGESEQSVARREKAKRTRIVSPQERMIRYLYEQFIGGDEELRDFLKALSDLDDVAERAKEFRLENERSWRRAA